MRRFWFIVTVCIALLCAGLVVLHVIHYWIHWGFNRPADALQHEVDCQIYWMIFTILWMNAAILIRGRARIRRRKP